MTANEYVTRRDAAGPLARRADELLEEFRSTLGLRRAFGVGSLKLTGDRNATVVFHPQPVKKDTPGLRVELPFEDDSSWANGIRDGVKQVGGTRHKRYSLIPTSLLVDRWNKVRDGVLVPFFNREVSLSTTDHVVASELKLVSRTKTRESAHTRGWRPS